MRTVPIPASDVEILNIIQDWIELLAQERYKEAHEMLYQPEDNSWTSELVKNAISGYKSSGNITNDPSYVTPIQEVQTGEGINPNRDIQWFTGEDQRKDKYAGVIHFDLPINGEWSDLTAIFFIHQLEEVFAIELETIHIL
jgi:hypothetical protein